MKKFFLICLFFTSCGIFAMDNPENNGFYPTSEKEIQEDRWRYFNHRSPKVKHFFLMSKKEAKWQYFRQRSAKTNSLLKNCKK